MKVLIQNARLVHPSHPRHGTLTDIFIQDGTIKQIGDDLDPSGCRVIARDNLHVSVGWMDCFANFCDPGEEYNETIATGARAAAAGGFTDVMLVPNTLPVINSKSQVEYVIQQGRATPVNLYPIGAVTQNTEEKELAEMYDMAHSGAVAFSDGKRPVQSSGMLQKALEYMIAIDGVIIQLPDDRSIGRFGLMNEGIVSTRLGLPGKPAISEELMIARDIEIVRYTGSKIHFTGISTAKSAALIAQARQEGLQVTCSTTPYHLFFCDEDLAEYDTNLKVNPPIRTKHDREALRQAVNTGIIDFVASHHQPRDYDHKVCEFEKAAFGMETLEAVFGAAGACGIAADHFVKMQTENIRKIFGIPMPEIDEGKQARLTLFVPDVDVVLAKEDIFSKSTNNAFLGKRLSGQVTGIVNHDKSYLI